VYKGKGKDIDLLLDYVQREAMHDLVISDVIQALEKSMFVTSLAGAVDSGNQGNGRS
jgi:hypothetical protein